MTSQPEKSVLLCKMAENHNGDLAFFIRKYRIIPSSRPVLHMETAPQRAGYRYMEPSDYAHIALLCNPPKPQPACRGDALKEKLCGACRFSSDHPPLQHYRRQSGKRCFHYSESRRN